MNLLLNFIDYKCESLGHDPEDNETVYIRISWFYDVQQKCCSWIRNWTWDVSCVFADVKAVGNDKGLIKFPDDLLWLYQLIPMYLLKQKWYDYPSMIRLSLFLWLISCAWIQAKQKNAVYRRPHPCKLCRTSNTSGTVWCWTCIL